MAKDEVKVGKLQFNDLLYSEIGEDMKLEPKEGFEGLEHYGSMKRKVFHYVRVITKLCPWDKAVVKKHIVDLMNGKDKVYIKYVTVRLSDVKEVGSKNLDEAFDYIVKMLTATNIEDVLYNAWQDAMCERRFSIERVLENEKHEITAITFRFIATKFNDTWRDQTKNETERVVTRIRRPETIEEEQKEFAKSQEMKQQKPKKTNISKKTKKPAEVEEKKAKKDEDRDEEVFTIGDAINAQRS